MQLELVPSRRAAVERVTEKELCVTAHGEETKEPGVMDSSKRELCVMAHGGKTKELCITAHGEEAKEPGVMVTRERESFVTARGGETEELFVTVYGETIIEPCVPAQRRSEEEPCVTVRGEGGGEIGAKEKEDAEQATAQDEEDPKSDHIKPRGAPPGQLAVFK